VYKPVPYLFVSTYLITNTVCAPLLYVLQGATLQESVPALALLASLEEFVMMPFIDIRSMEPLV
jgi:hypothetical protein